MARSGQRPLATFSSLGLTFKVAVAGNTRGSRWSVRHIGGSAMAAVWEPLWRSPLDLHRVPAPPPGPLQSHRPKQEPEGREIDGCVAMHLFRSCTASARVSVPLLSTSYFVLQVR